VSWDEDGNVLVYQKAKAEPRGVIGDSDSWQRDHQFD
jgi:hypothetical protein